MGGVRFEGMWCGRCEEINRSGFWEGIRIRSRLNQWTSNYRMKDLKVWSALEVTIVVPSGDLWKGQIELARSSGLLVGYHWALLKYFELSNAVSAVRSLICSSESELFSRLGLSLEVLAAKVRRKSAVSPRRRGLYMAIGATGQ